MRLNAIILVLALVMSFSFAGPSCSIIIDEPGPFVLPGNLYDDCVAIVTDDVELDCNGNTIDCEGSMEPGIYLSSDLQNIEIHDCFVRNCQHGLYFNHAEYLNVHDNIFEYNGIGIVDGSVFSLINSTIANNTINWSAGTGMAFARLNNSVISNNELYENCWDADLWDVALYIAIAQNSIIEENYIHDNNCPGIWILDPYLSIEFVNQNISILENEVYENDGYGIDISNAGNSSINNNEVYGNNGIGIAVHDSANITIDPNIVYGNAYDGIYVEESDHVYTLDNVVYENCGGIPGDCGGIAYDHVNFSTIEGNEVYGHGYIYPAIYAGILIWSTAEVDVYDNNLYGNMYGIYSRDGEELIIEECNVHDNEFAGIRLESGEHTEVIGCTVNGNGFVGSEDSAGLFALDEEFLYIGHSNFDNNFHGIALIETAPAYLEDLEVSNSWIHGIALEAVEMEFFDITLRDNWAAIGMVMAEVEGEGLFIYGNTEVYLAQEEACLGAGDVWLGFDRFYGLWYEGIGVCNTWVIDDENILLRSDFVSLDTSDDLDDFEDPDLVTTRVGGCNGLEYHLREGFPESRAEILEFGETFSPGYTSCIGTRATYTVPGLLTGYTASGQGDSSSGGSDYEPECERDSDCGECEYCSIANNACLPSSSTECTSDSDCEEGASCEDCKCVMEQAEPEPEPEGGEGEEPECTNDIDCIAGFVCVLQECVEEVGPECLEDSDCPVGLVCVAQTCVEKEPEGPTKEEAEKALEDAKEAVEKAKSEGKDTSKAEALLADAEGAFSDGDYGETIDLAEKVKLAAQAAAEPPEEEETFVPISEELPSEEETPPAEEGFPWIWVLGGLVLLGIIAWFLLKGK